MDDQAPSFNPYEPPKSIPSDGSLAPDTAFLFSEKVVAGVGSIVLPPVCVVTGATSSLDRYDTRLWWCSRWITVPFRIVTLLAIFIGLPLILQPLPRIAPVTSNPMLSVFGMALGVGLLALAFGLLVATWLRRQSVRVQWYVSAETVRKHKRDSGIILGIVAVLMVMSWMHSASFFMLLIIGAIAATRLLRGPRVLEVIVHRDGLFYVGGMSPEFLAEVRRMSDLYNSSQT
jgi:hypothetical protein